VYAAAPRVLYSSAFLSASRFSSATTYSRLNLSSAIEPNIWRRYECSVINVTTRDGSGAGKYVVRVIGRPKFCPMSVDA
jgi:hypothetical protein